VKAMQAVVLGLTAILCLFGITMPAEATPVIRDQCNQTSGDGQGHSCPGPDDLLIRPKYADGTCGDWMCCPPNPDGKTYDCAHATNPTRSAVGGVLRNLLGPRASAVDPVMPFSSTNPPSFFQQQRAPIFRRGVEGEGEATNQAGSEQGPPSEGGDIQERAIPRPGLGAASFNCYCDGGTGSCTVTSDGTNSTCSKGPDGTCTGTCKYPKGTTTGIGGGMIRQ
jgi:hypothetical protein